MSAQYYGINIIFDPMLRAVVLTAQRSRVLVHQQCEGGARFRRIAHGTVLCGIRFVF